MKEESEKAGLKCSIQKMKIMASSPITSWQIEGGNVEAVTNCIVKAMAFPLVMYGCESWSIKKAECQRIDAFELWCWRRLLRIP